MIREVIESFGFAQVTNSKYVKGSVTLLLSPSDLEILIMTFYKRRIIKVKDISSARKSIENFLKHVGE